MVNQLPRWIILGRWQPETSLAPNVDADVPWRGAFTRSGGATGQWGSRGRTKWTTLSIPEAAIPWAKGFIVRMDISGNDLTTLPEAFYDTLKSLEVLNVSRNCLWELSPKIKQLRALKSLDIHGNLLETLPDELVSPSCPQPRSSACGLCHANSCFADWALCFKT